MTEQVAEAAEIAAEPSGDQPESADALKAALKAERDARRKFEREYKATAARLTEFEDANKSDLEKLLGERDALKAALAQEQARVRAVQTEAVVRDAAEAAGSTNPRLVWRLVKDDLELDEAGKPINLGEAIAQAKADAPQLFGPGGKADAGRPAGQPAGPERFTDLIRQRAGFGD